MSKSRAVWNCNFSAAAMSDIKIKIAAEIDSAAISDFICVNFNDQEPIQVFHVRKGELMDPPPRSMVKECIESQTTLLAYEGDDLVGVLIAGEISTDVAEKDLEYAEEYGPKGVDVFALLAYVGDKADICNRLNIPRCLHVHIMSIHLNHLKKGIAKKLFEYCIENGRSKNFPALSVDCTNYYTSKIAESFGMSCLSTVTYDEYNDHIGATLFVPSEPHTEIKSFAKLYD